MIKQVECHVCSSQTAKYKCPQCMAKYCSVSCYKTHKEKLCVSIQPVIGDGGESGECLLIQSTQKEREDGEISDSDQEFETEDKVPKEKLEKLGESKDLLTVLDNPHLRRMMTSLCESSNPGKLMEEAMKEPIFTEFADKCLSIVEQKKT